jgi:hypothetical protein
MWPIKLASEVYSTSQPFMPDTLLDDVLYLTALLPEDQSMAVPRLSGIIPDCGAWIRSRSYVQPGTARFVFEFPRDICIEIYSALVSVGLQLTPASHQLLTELCRCTPHVFDPSSRKLPAVDVATLDAATRYICSLEIIKVQLQIWMVNEADLKSHVTALECFAA